MEGFEVLGADEPAKSTENLIKSAGDKETTADKAGKYLSAGTSVIDKIVSWAKGTTTPVPPTTPMFGSTGLSPLAIAGIALAGLAVVGGGVYLAKR